MAVLELEGSRQSWKRAAQLGTVLIVFGIVTLSAILNSSAVPAAVIGWLLVLSGMAEAVHAFRIRRSDGFLFHLVPGVAAVPIGLLTATHPGRRRNYVDADVRIVLHGDRFIPRDCGLLVEVSQLGLDGVGGNGLAGAGICDVGGVGMADPLVSQLRSRPLHDSPRLVVSDVGAETSPFEPAAWRRIQAA